MKIHTEMQIDIDTNYLKVILEKNKDVKTAAKEVIVPAVEPPKKKPGRKPKKETAAAKEPGDKMDAQEEPDYIDDDAMKKIEEKMFGGK